MSITLLALTLDEIEGMKVIMPSLLFPVLA